MKKYKGILLVLASEDVKNTQYITPRILPEWEPLYPTFKKIYEAYCETNPNIKVLFVYGNQVYFSPKEHDLVFDVFENDYPGMISKTLKAMQYIENNYDYDFLIRTNLSTFWDLHKLEARLDMLPKQKCLTGSPVNLKNPRSDEQYNYVAGYDLVISRDLVQTILPHASDIIAQKVFQNMEDLSLCTAVEKYAGVVRSGTDNIQNHATNIGKDPYTKEHLEQMFAYSVKKNTDHFRVKTRTNRNADKQYLKNLLEKVYGQTIP